MSAITLFACAMSTALVAGGKPKEFNQIFFSPSIQLLPGQILKHPIDIDFPPGEIAITGFTADLVFDDDSEIGNPVPLTQTYLHHWTVQQRINHNSGFCDYEAKRTGNLKLSYLFGVGSESRGTPIAFESPYGLVVNDSDKWAVDLHAIDLRDTIDPLGCRECLCQETGVKPRRKGYIGGLACCEDMTRCRTHSTSYTKDDIVSYRLRYNVTWREDIENITPLYIFVMDVTGELSHTEERACMIEYDIPRFNNTGSEIYRRNSTFFFPQDGRIIHAVAHLHSGAMFAEASRASSGEVVCRGDAIYGTGTTVGNEEGYVVAISQCPEGWQVRKGEAFNLDVFYNTTGGLTTRSDVSHVGVMGYMWMATARETTPKRIGKKTGAQP
eukprot:jgi/Bigna1/89912/estExt_fgenesh1_pg.C_580015